MRETTERNALIRRTADVIASWNFKHLVNPLRIRGFNGVNAAQGYGSVLIMTPRDLAKVWQEQEDEPDA